MNSDKNKSRLNISEIETDEISTINQMDEYFEDENDDISMEQFDKIKKNDIDKIARLRKRDDNYEYIDEIDELIDESLRLASFCGGKNKESCKSLYLEKITPKLDKLLLKKSKDLPIDELSQLIKDLHDTINY